MNTTTWQNSVYARLLQLSRQGAVHAHLAYLAAGCLSLIGICPAGLPAKTTSLRAVLGGAVILLVVLVLLGPVLNFVQPALRAAGQLSGTSLAALGCGALLAGAIAQAVKFWLRSSNFKPASR